MGNLITAGNKTFTYTGKQLSKVTDVYGTNHRTMTYQYNAAGIRTKKVIFPNSQFYYMEY